MANIIVAFSKQEDGINVRNLLVRNGYTVNAVVTSGGQVLNNLDNLRYGIVISGYRYPDMICSELRENLPKDVAMVVMAASRLWSDNRMADITYIDIPIKLREMLGVIEETAANQDRLKRKERMNPKKRSNEDRELVQTAKHRLMEKRGWEEEVAYRYIQKTSMNSGNSLTDVAKMILEMYQD